MTTLDREILDFIGPGRIIQIHERTGVYIVGKFKLAASHIQDWVRSGYVTEELTSVEDTGQGTLYPAVRLSLTPFGMRALAAPVGL